MDGRRETVYSDAFLQRHLAIYYGWPGWQGYLQQINPEHIWLPKSLPTTSQIAALGWSPILETPESIVFSRIAKALTLEPRELSNCFP